MPADLLTPGAGQGGEDSLSVADAVSLAKTTLSRIPTLTVTGEITGWRGPNRTGHCYFSLKDELASMDVIVWRGTYDKLDPQLRSALNNGLLVQARGSFDVYDKTGKLSFVIRSISVAGEGLLRQRVAELARRLQSEGLMDEARKRPIPAFCMRVGVVTSLTGSVIEDVKRTLARRNPLVELLVAGCAVQGEAAPGTIVRAIALAASYRPDCILLVRGGGSYEDLMAFNDESVARAVASCPVPVVSGIGHEDDITICDMVADRRASTPTAAAEGVAPAIGEIIDRNSVRASRLDAALAATVSSCQRDVDGLALRSRGAIESRLTRERAALEQLGRHGCLTDPRWIVSSRRMSLMQTADRLVEALPRSVSARQGELTHLANRLVGLAPRITQAQSATVGRSAAALDALSPLKVLGRGYSIVRDSLGHVVSHAGQVAVGDTIGVVMADGCLEATVSASSATGNPIQADD